MSILRQFNWLGQARIDVPHLRAVESSIAADFDVLAGKMLGGALPLILKGFNISVTTGTIGGAASTLQVVVANGMVIHYGASESGSIFLVPSTRSPETLNSVTNSTNVTGTFTVSATNYVGFDLIRTSDSATADVVQFLDANTLLETPRSVPLGRTLNYKFIISTTPFSANTNVCPIAKVVTDASGNVVSITDARIMMFRLGSGGDNPNVQYAYPWAAGRREITTINSSSDMFTGGDKQLASHADWADAIMTRLWELGGGEYWYTPTADRDVKMVRTGSAMANGDWFTWDGTNLTWQGIKFLFANSTATFNDVADGTGTNYQLADGDCVYVDLDRTTNRTGGTALTGVKVAMTNMGAPTVPGSRFIMAWRNGSVIYARDQAYSVGGQFTAGTPSALGIVKISATSSTPSAPFAATSDSSGNVIGIGLTRNNGSGFSAGNIGIGTGSNDNTVNIGRAGQSTSVAGSLTVAQAGSFTIGATATGANGGATGTAGFAGTGGTGTTTGGAGVTGQGGAGATNGNGGAGGTFTGGAGAGAGVAGPGIIANGSAARGAIMFTGQTTPSTPSDGDVWYDTSATLPRLFARLNGVTAGTVQSMTLDSGYTGSGGLGYWKDATGTVHLKGIVQNNTGGGLGIGTTGLFLVSNPLAAGYRPASTRTFMVPTLTVSTVVIIQVTSAGLVSLASWSGSIANTVSWDLSSIHFLAEG
jgi:hypothetical protein